MARIRRCDLCGEVYEDNILDVTQSNIQLWSKDEYEEHDACPHCTEQLKLFMDVLKSGEDYHIYIGQKEET